MLDFSVFHDGFCVCVSVFLLVFGGRSGTERGAAAGTAGLRQDAAGQSGGHRGGRALPVDERLRVHRNDRRPRRRPSPRPFQGPPAPPPRPAHFFPFCLLPFYFLAESIEAFQEIFSSPIISEPVIESSLSHRFQSLDLCWISVSLHSAFL